MFNTINSLNGIFTQLEKLTQTYSSSVSTSPSSSSSSLSGTMSSSDDESPFSSLFFPNQRSEPVSRSKRKQASVLPAKAQVSLLQRVLEGDLSIFHSIENWNEYTPRQLLIIEFVNYYNRIKDINFLYLINDLILLGENPNEIIELDPTLQISPIYRLLLNQTALLDIPLKRINSELDTDHLSNFYSANPTCMLQITKRMATLLKSSTEFSLESLHRCSVKMEEESLSQKTAAARSLSGRKGRGKRGVIIQIDPSKVKSTELEALDKSIKKINSLYVIGKKQVLKRLDQIKKKVPSGRVSDVHAISVMQFQMQHLDTCHRQLQHQITKLQTRFENALTNLARAEHLFGSSTIEMSMLVDNGKERSKLILSNLEQLDFSLSVLSKSYAAYNERFCSHFHKQQQSLGFAEQLLHTTEKLELSQDELAQLEVERANSQSDSDSEIESFPRPLLLVESPKATCRSVLDTSMSTSGSKMGSTGSKKAKGKRGKKGGKQKSTQTKPSSILSLPPTASASEPLQSSSSSSSSSSTVRVVEDFQTLKHSYGWSWEAALEKFAEKQQNQVKTPYFRTRIKCCKMESIQHLHYSFVGFELLQQAIEKKNWPAVGEILPAFVMDLAIQVEQVLNISNIVKNKPDMLHHDLMLLTNLTSLDEQLSERTQKHLEEISVAMMWARYPVNSKRYYTERQMECPPVLKLILRSQQLMRGKSLTEADQKIMIENVYALYKEHLAASTEVLETLNQTKELTPITEQMISYVNEEQEQHLRGVANEHADELKSDSLLSDEISKMKTALKQIFKAAKREPGLKILKIKMKVQECMNHLNRLKQTLDMLDGMPAAHHQAWIFRNYLKVQQVLEGLYQIRSLLRGEADLLTHYLNDYHTLLQDSEEMSQSFMFDFGKQIHYSQSQNSHPSAVPLIKHLNHLEGVMKEIHGDGFNVAKKGQSRMQTTQAWDESKSREMVSQIVDSSFSVINMHLEACMRELSLQNEERTLTYEPA